MTTIANMSGVIGVNPVRYTVPNGTASTTVALSGPGEFAAGTPALIAGNKSIVYVYEPSTYGGITNGTRFDLTATFETSVNASGKYVNSTGATVPAGSYFWATIYASAL